MPQRAEVIPGKWRSLALLAAGELAIMALWFSASAVVPQLTAEWELTGQGQAWLTLSVQIGFVVGALGSALFNLADRWPTPLFIGGSAFLGAGLTAGIALTEIGPAGTVVLRFLTGVVLAGVYPPGMKMVATWCTTDRGLGIGILVGALTVGSALPHLLNAIPLAGEVGMPPWPDVLLAASLLAVLGGAVCLCVRVGPFAVEVPPFDWRFTARVFRDRPTRLANFGYLGHMWELYAMWTWAPLCLIASYERATWDVQTARLAGFGTVALGAAGCVLAGLLADRLGRTLVASASLVVSGLCSVGVGLVFDHPGVLTLVCLVWGFAVVADSAQFSAAVSELTDRRYVGTALTVQTSLGFLLTLVTIQIVPQLVEAVGWRWAFSVLALGPAFGLWSMLTLRCLPESARMASGHR